MSSADVGRIVCAVLDPVLVLTGFAAGQGGGNQVIFCAAHDSFSDRFPSLPQADAQQRGEGACVDLVVNVDDDGGFESADLEGMPLAMTLRRIGRNDDAEAVVQVQGAPLDVALPVLGGVLSGMFSSPR